MRLQKTLDINDLISYFTKRLVATRSYYTTIGFGGAGNSIATGGCIHPHAGGETMKMMKRKTLSEAEWNIMEAVWDAEAPVSVREVVQKLYPKGEKAYTTVQTFMNILVNKGYLKKQKIGMVNFYTPLVPRENAVRKATQTLVSRIFHGSFGALAAYLVHSDALSPEEISELKAMIARKEAEMKERRHD